MVAAAASATAADIARRLRCNMCFSLCDSGGDARTGCIFIVVQSSPEQTQEKDMFRTRLRTRLASLAINDDFTAAAIRNQDEPCDIPSARGDRRARILIAGEKNSAGKNIERIL